MYTVRVWDLPLRLFHWILVFCLVGMVVTATLGWMEWHLRCGYLILDVLLFRFVWGFAGGHWGRFVNFLPRPSILRAYLRGSASPHASVGHNPLGALSVLAMLMALSLQVASGFASDDEIAASGPLVHHLESTWVAAATFFHTKIGKFLVLGLALLHVAAMVVYRLQGNNLVPAMVLGDKHLPFPAISSEDGPALRVRALWVFMACTACVYALVQALN